MFRASGAQGAHGALATCKTLNIQRKRQEKKGFLTAKALFDIYLLVSDLQVFPHLLIGDPEEGLTGPSVAEAACAHMNVVQAGHSVHLRVKEDVFFLVVFLKIIPSITCSKHAVITNYCEKFMTCT